MRISELSERTGMTTATIKYYLREGLIPPGRATAPNQASYDEAHVTRLRLVRALREVGGLGIDQIREVVASLDDPGQSLHAVLGISQAALAPRHDSVADEDLQAVEQLLVELGWTIDRDAPDRRTLAAGLASLRQLGQPVSALTFLPYAQAVEPVAAWEIASLETQQSREAKVELAIVGTVVYEAVMNALRRLAHEHHSASTTATADG